MSKSPHASTYRKNLGPHMNRGLPQGHASRAFRIQAEEGLLEAFGRMTPEARGRVLAEAMKAEVAR